MSAALPPDVEVRRSARRKRTVSAHREGERIVITAPERMSQRMIVEYAEELIIRLRRRERDPMSDTELLTRASWLRMEFVPEAPEPTAVNWSTRQQRQWGSCTPLDRTIRISARLQRAPQYVIDYVLVHELAHLVHADHGPAFSTLERRYPEIERAEAFLAGADFGAGSSTEL